MSSNPKYPGIPKLYTRANQIILDAICFALALSLAYFIRFEGWPVDEDLRQLIVCLPLFVLARITAHYALNVYRLVWRFVSISDSIKIARSIALVSSLLLALRFLYPRTAPLSEWVRIPVSIIFLEGLLSLLFSLAIRAARRMHYTYQRTTGSTGMPTKRVLLYGAGRAGLMLRKEIENSPAYEVVGFIDDDPQKVGTVISDTRVVGSGDELEKLVQDYHIEEIIISMATATASTLAKTLAKCRRAQIPAKIIPSLREILGGQVQISQFRDTQVEEVLGRESIEVRDFPAVAGPTYRGKRILVTGAGGSIGSELVRQLVRLSPSRVAILDKDENSIYELEQELIRRKVSFPIEPQIADVRNEGRLRAVFSEFRPQAIFHAAAHKHVPLMELHPCEAILNNVGGTKNVLDASIEFRVERFVFISSDKAVNPTNVMGATKRVGELLVQSLTKMHGPRFACVRFGNVLGSRGSVVPLFKKQIAEGGPVTVTHPDVMRYFMTIREAVQLILCAGTMAKRGEIFVLDMGNPRNILELAREMILLSGLEPGRDILTTITGLRPGEKLTEELVTPFESLQQTSLEKLSVIEPQPFNQGLLLSDVESLLNQASNNDPRRLLQSLRDMGLGYQGMPPKAVAMSAAASAMLVSFPPLQPAFGTSQETGL